MVVSYSEEVEYLGQCLGQSPLHLGTLKNVGLHIQRFSTVPRGSKGSQVWDQSHARRRTHIHTGDCGTVGPVDPYRDRLGVQWKP